MHQHAVASASTSAGPTSPSPSTCSPSPRFPAFPAPCATRPTSSPSSSRRYSGQPECSTAPHSTPLFAAAQRNVGQYPILGTESSSTYKPSDKFSSEFGGSIHGRDLEKGGYDMSNTSSQRSSNAHTTTSIVYREEEPRAPERSEQEEHATKILLFMSGPCVVLSAVNAVWTIVGVPLTILLQPLRCGANKPSLGQNLAAMLGPALNFHLGCIYAPLPVDVRPSHAYSPLSLVAVHLISPLLSFPLMFASWVLAIYWVSSAIVGDPAGQDKRDDGKETVLGLRSLWEMWLASSLYNR